MIAVLSGFQDIVFLLESVEKGASARMLSLHDNSLVPAFHFIANSTVLTQTIKLLSLESVLKLAQTQPPSFAAPFVQSVSEALVEVCGTGDASSAQYMLSLGANVNHCHPMHGTPLQSAVTHSDVTMTQWLLAQGALADPKCLVVACRNGQRDIAQILVDVGGVNLHEKVTGVGTAVHAVVLGGGSGDLLEWLVHKGAEVDAEDDTGCTALQVAVELGHKNLISKLIMVCHADTHRQLDGRTLTQLTTNADVAEYVRCLLTIKQQQQTIAEQEEKLKKIPMLEQRIVELESLVMQLQQQQQPTNQ